MYDPDQFWAARFRRHGPTYVAKGGRSDAFTTERHTVSNWLQSLPDLGTVLDYGCGVGRFADVLARHGEYVGYDIVSDAAALNPLPTVGEVPAWYDTLACIMVLQHIGDDDIIRKLGERARQGAVIVDAQPLDNPDPHMFPRTPDRVAELLGMEIVKLDDLGEHWAAVLARSP